MKEEKTSNIAPKQYADIEWNGITCKAHILYERWRYHEILDALRWYGASEKDAEIAAKWTMKAHLHDTLALKGNGMLAITITEGK